MNKILIILLTIPLIFSSCEKDEDNNNNNNNNNNITDNIVGEDEDNNNNITDNIVGEWVNFGESDNSDSYTWDPYTGDQRAVYNFLSDGTFELYIMLDGIINDDYKLYGNWTKVNGSSYDISYTYNNDGQQEIVQEIATTIFYCDNNIFRTTFDSDLDYDYWQKNGYDYQVCTDNYIQQ